MANDDAWSSGWAQGSGAAQKKKDKKSAAQPQKQSGMNMLAGAVGAFHKGGKVKKTGNYRLRKGEAVLTVKQQREVGIKKGGKKKANHKKRIASKG